MLTHFLVHAMHYYINLFHTLILLENRVEFLEKLQRVCGQIRSNTTVQPLLSHPGQCRLAVGNWSLSSQKEGEVAVRNSDGTRVSCGSIMRATTTECVRNISSLVDIQHIATVS